MYLFINLFHEIVIRYTIYIFTYTINYYFMKEINKSDQYFHTVQNSIKENRFNNNYVIQLFLYSSLSLSLSLSLCLSVSLSLFLSFSLYLCVSVSLSFSLSLSISMSLCLSVSVSLCLSFSLLLSFSLILKVLLIHSFFSKFSIKQR